MPGEPMIQPRRAAYAASLAISAAVGGLVATLIALQGGAAVVVGPIWIVTLTATMLGAWPLLAGGPMAASSFGALVMAGSGMRLLATLFLGAAIDLGVGGVAGHRTIFWIGVMIAAVVVLIADSAASITTLSKAKAGDEAGSQGGPEQTGRMGQPAGAASMRESA